MQKSILLFIVVITNVTFCSEKTEQHSKTQEKIIVQSKRIRDGHIMLKTITENANGRRKTTFKEYKPETVERLECQEPLPEVTKNKNQDNNNTSSATQPLLTSQKQSLVARFFSWLKTQPKAEAQK